MASSLELLLLAQASTADTVTLSGNTTVNSVTMATLLTIPVAAGGGGYKLRVMVGCLAGASAGTPQLRLTTGGSGAATSAAGFEFHVIGNSAVSSPVWSTSTGGTLSGPAMAAPSTQYVMIMEGTLSFSTGGSLSLQAATSNAADAWTAQAGSFFTLTPIP